MEQQDDPVRARNGRLPVFRHVLPVVGVSAPAALRDAQRTTIASIGRARELSRDRVTVEVVGARFPDEDAPDLPWLRDAPVLLISSQDVGTFRVPRRLPLLREVLAGFGDVVELDALILTNTDIGIRPDFYEIVKDILVSGYDAFTINRRSVSPVFGGERPALAAAAVGAPHPGTDCFVLRPGLLARIEVGRVLMGTRYVARALFEELRHHAQNFRVFGELHATFHVGDERVWTRPELADYEAFNLAELEVGRGRRTTSEPPAPAPSGGGPAGTATTAIPGGRSTREDAHELVFCAATARSGTMFLAELLDAVPGVDAGHERPPRMSGPWLRDVSERGLAAAYGDRTAKVAAIRVELERLRARTTYVDTSHLFLTMFHDVVLDAFDHRRISIVDLRRDPVDVARSMYELGWFSDRGAHWSEWLLDGAGPGSPVEVGSDELRDPLDRIVVHIARVLHLRDALRGLTPTVRWVRADLRNLRTQRGHDALLKALGMRPVRRGPLELRRRINARVERKRAAGVVIEREAVRHRIGELLARFEDRGGLRSLREEVERW